VAVNWSPGWAKGRLLVAVVLLLPDETSPKMLSSSSGPFLYSADSSDGILPSGRTFSKTADLTGLAISSAGTFSERSYNPYTGTYRADRASYNPYTGTVRGSSGNVQR
jgi:hypothetical protein